MKGSELHDQTTDELNVKLGELREELFNLRFQGATGQLDNHRRIRLVKRDIARVKTVMRLQELAESEAAPAEVEL
jgi:large subunit ribosomal protein L29